MLSVTISEIVDQKHKIFLFITFLITAQSGICKYSDPYSA